MTTTPAPILLQNGRILDPANGVDKTADLLIQDGVIHSISSSIDPPSDTEIIDVSDCLVAPGLVDMHVHFRDPGFPEKETIESGSRAAAAGGFTSVACLPNTDPVCDSAAVVKDILKKAERADARVYPIAAATVGMQGQALTDIDGLLAAGAIGFSDDGLPIESDKLMRDLLVRSKASGFAIYPHSEVFDLTRGGAMHDGAVSRALGIPGMPAEGETQMVERDIGLVRETGGRLHVLHVSARRTVEVIRAAKAEGLPVTCEACPHHFTLTEEDIRVYGTAAKMSPPLRTADDVEAIIEGLADGTIDAIATDHAPHTDEEKLRSFAEAPNGILGLETAVGSVFDELVEPGALSAADAIRKLTIEPARILGIDAGTLSIGAAADVTVIDPDMEWQVDAHAFASKSRNTPFHGWTMNGRAVLTVLGGRVTYRTGER